MVGKRIWVFGCLSAMTTLACNAHQATTRIEAATAPTPMQAAAPTTESAKAPSLVHIAQDIVTACGLSRSDTYFDYDSAKLRTSDVGILNELATCFSTGPMKGRSLRLIGHADPRGETEYNFVLGQSRADSVAQYLENHSVDRNRVYSTSRGELDADGVDESGWARDRRVDVQLGAPGGG
jgi:peptidoglycan-associated lipoprotein